MDKNGRTGLVAIFIGLSCVSLCCLGDTAPRLVCYYENWAIYRHQLAQFTPLNIPPHLCTHIHYAFGTVNDRGQLGPSDGNSDLVRHGYQQVALLKQHNPQLVTVLSMGGSDVLQARFETIAQNATLKQQFVDNCIGYLMQHRFDGLELDWQLPSTADRHIALVESLARAFKSTGQRRGQSRLLLSVTLPVDLQLLHSRFHTARVSAAADYVVSLQYRYHSAVSNTTGHHAPLRTTPRADPQQNMEASALIYRAMRVPPNKLVLGVATFGVTATLADPQRKGFGAPSSGAGRAGKLTKSAGSLAFYEICENIASEGWKAIRDYPFALGPYAYNNDQWVAYDDELMMRMKGEFVRTQGLGGLAVWSLSQDDYRGFCTGKQFPLISALKLGLYGLDRVAQTSTPEPPTTPEYNRRKIFVCPANGNFPKVDECNKFFFCKNDKAEELECPSGEVFSSNEGKCTSEETCTAEEPEMVSQFPPTPLPSANSLTNFLIDNSEASLPANNTTPRSTDSSIQITDNPESLINQVESPQPLTGPKKSNNNVVPPSFSSPVASVQQLVDLISLVQQFARQRERKANGATEMAYNQTSANELSQTNHHRPHTQSSAVRVPIIHGSTMLTPLRVHVVVDVKPTLP